MQTINLNIVPNGITPIVYVSQGDVGREIAFVLQDGDIEYTIPTSAVVCVQGTKPDGHSFMYDSSSNTSVISFDGATVTVKTTEQMTIANGNVICEIKIASGDTILYTLNFVLHIEKAALPNNANMSKSDLPLITQAIDSAEYTLANTERAAQSAKEAAQSAKEAAQSAKEAAAAITGVESWNGRKGDVVPQSWDYSADMITMDDGNTVETDLSTLIGSDTGKSARTIANEELVTQLIPEDAKASMDTLKEIAAWIQSHPDDASAMNEAITELKNELTLVDNQVSANTANIRNKADSSTVAALQTTVAGKADKATTLAGYGITDAATDARMTSAENSISKLNALINIYEPWMCKRDGTAASGYVKFFSILRTGGDYINAIISINEYLLDSGACSAIVQITSHSTDDSSARQVKMEWLTKTSNWTYSIIAVANGTTTDFYIALPTTWGGFAFKILEISSLFGNNISSIYAKTTTNPVTLGSTPTAFKTLNV